MEQCVICYRTVRTDEELEICVNCGTKFHLNCYKLSIFQSKKCPYCRDSIFRKIIRRILPGRDTERENPVFEFEGTGRGWILISSLLTMVMFTLVPFLLLIGWKWSVGALVCAILFYYEMKNQWMLKRYVVFRYQLNKIQRKMVRWAN